MRDVRFLFHLWTWVVIGAPFWWLLGLNLFFYHFAVFVLFLVMLYVYAREGYPLFLPSSFLWLSLLVFVYLGSLMIQGRAGGADRFIASVYNLSFWLMGAGLSLVLANAFSREDVRTLLRTFSILGWVTGLTALAMVFVAVHGTRTVIFPSVLYHYMTRHFGDSYLVQNSVMVMLLHSNWLIWGAYPRLNLLSPYATATGNLMMIVLIMVLTRAAIETKIKKAFFFILIFLNIMALVMTLARTALFALITSLIFVSVLKSRKTLLWGVLIILLFSALTPWLNDFVDWFLKLREGSSINRLDLYRYSLEQMEGVNWILGYGMKPREESAFTVPIGSHSTYLSLLFKTGILGTSVFFLFQSMLLWRWYKLKECAMLHEEAFALWRGLGAVFWGIAITMFTGDIDAPQFLAFIYFSLIGIFEGFRRNLIRGSAATAGEQR